MNPILTKDVLAQLRVPRTAFMVFAFAFVLAAVTMLTWPTDGLVPLAQQGQDDLLLGLMLGQLAMLVLFVPAASAVSLTDEKQANTLEMLYATRLKPSQIIVGKVLATLTLPIMLLIIGLPLAAMLLWRGDAALGQLGAGYAVLAGAGIWLAALGLAVSSVAATSGSALVLTYAIVLVLCIGTVVPAAIVLANVPSPYDAVLHLTRSLSPVAAMGGLLRPNDASLGGGDRAFLPAWQIFLAFASLTTIVALGIVAAKLRKAPLADERTSPSSKAGRLRSILVLIDDTKPPAPFTGGNPILQKERRTNKLGTGRWMIRIAYASLALSLSLSLLAIFGGIEHPDLLGYVATILVTLMVAVVMLVAPSLTASGISGEVESDTFELLRLSRLSATSIFLGKLLPGLLPALLPVLAMAPTFLVMGTVKPEYFPFSINFAPVAVLLVVFSCVAGLCCSVWAGITTRATVLAYTIVGTVVLLPMVPFLLSGRIVGEALAARLAVPSPLAMGLALQPTSNSTLRELLPLHLGIMGGLTLLLLLAAWFGLVRQLRKG